MQTRNSFNLSLHPINQNIKLNSMQIECSNSSKSENIETLDRAELLLFSMKINEDLENFGENKKTSRKESKKEET